MRITLPSGTSAELVTPSGAATRGLVVVPDVMGLRPLFVDLCERLSAEHGWSVCCFEPFPGRESMSLEERFKALAETSDDLLLGDAAAAADATGADPVAIMGFCMGGMYALKAAGSGRFDRAVPFYGMIRVPDDWKGAGQGEPLDALAQPGAAAVMAIVGTADKWTPPADVEALEAAGATVVRYEGADHGFVHDPDRPAHRPDDAADAWRRTVEFLTA